MRTIVLGFLVLLVGCQHTPPTRPSNVPATAVWSGGPDGGDWFECESTQSSHNRCTVYADVSGAVVESGRYQLKGERRAASKEELKYAYHSKGHIFLQGNKVLEKID